MLSLNDTISRSPRTAQRLFEERMLVITVDDSKLHRLNEVATFIWQLLDVPRTVGEISDLVARHFAGCSAETALKDVRAVAKKMVARGLVALKAERETGHR
jgi:hypothetical protein